LLEKQETGIEIKFLEKSWNSITEFEKKLLKWFDTQKEPINQGC
jgi:hypothetical protein